MRCGSRRSCHRYFDKIDDWHREPHKLRGLATGFTDFDNKTGGLRPGDLIVVAGRPSMGKSTLAVNMAEYAACNPAIRASVAIFTLEMPSEQVLTPHAVLDWPRAIEQHPQRQHLR